MALLLSLLFSLSACRKPSDSNHTETDTERFEKLYYGHDIEKVLTRHTSSLLETNLFFNDEKVSTDYLYADANTHCLISPTGVSYLNSRTQSVITAGEHEGRFLTYICDTDDTYREWFEGEYSEFSAKPLGEETLYDTEEKDGSFIAYTELKDADALKNTFENIYFPSGGYDYEEGMSLRFKYVFDLSSSDLKSTDAWVVDADGKEHLLVQETYTYDEAFDYAWEDSPLHDYFHAGETVRTITVTYSPGAENEVTRQCTIPRHTAFSVYKGGEAVASFTDPACTQPFAGSDGVSDMHLYVK